MEGVIWKGSPNHYSGRSGYQVTHITLHIMVGYLAGTDSTCANSASQDSAHYGIGADGTIHQYVSERDGSYSDAIRCVREEKGAEEDLKNGDGERYIFRKNARQLQAETV